MGLAVPFPDDIDATDTNTSAFDADMQTVLGIDSWPSVNKTKQINLQFNLSRSGDRRLYNQLLVYGRDKKKRLLAAVDLYETLNDPVNTENAVQLLRTDYPHIILELRDYEQVQLDKRLQALENSMRDMATKDDIKEAVEEIKGNLYILATQKSVDEINNKLQQAANYFIGQYRKLNEYQKAMLGDGKENNSNGE